MTRTVGLELEIAERAACVRIAHEWIGTPYHHMARVKGSGCDCLTLIACVYEEAGVVHGVELPHYSSQWHLHHSEELYMNRVLERAREVEKPEAGDMMLVRFGRAFSHGTIVTEWPNVIHATMGRGVLQTNADNDGDMIGRERKFFSLWE
jgi:cell wall-associated NlpC family hydrolase